MASVEEIVASFQIPEHPYPGLRSFAQTEAMIFFGRDKQIHQVLEKVGRSRFLGVVGESGCGKSSLIRAGLIPSLLEGHLRSAGTSWRVATMRPGDHPMRNLAAALLQAGMVRASPSAGTSDVDPRTDRAEDVGFLESALREGPIRLAEVLSASPGRRGESVLLLIDQFEEVFRFRPDVGAAHRVEADGEESITRLSTTGTSGKVDRDEAAAFVALLIESTRQTDVPIYVILTMRSDFLGRCALFANLPEALNESQFLTPRLSFDQRRQAIEGPARVCGGQVEPALTTRLLNDMGTGPDRLPLMQHALMRLWNRARPSSADVSDPIVLRLKDYEAIGGLDGALSKHVDHVFLSLTKPQTEIARTLFRALTEGSATQRDTRRPTRLGEVAASARVTADQVKEVVEVFRRPGRNFLMPPASVPLSPETLLDISHESLIRQWKRLRDWVDEEVEAAAIYLRLEQTARLWADGRADLLTERELRRVRTWRLRERPNAAWSRRYGGDFDLSLRFLNESKARFRLDREKEREEQRRAHEANERDRRLVRLKTTIKFTAASLLVSLSCLVLAIWNAKIAHDNSILAKASEKRADEQKILARNQAQYATEQEIRARNEAEIAKRQTTLANSLLLASKAQGLTDRYPIRSLLLATQAIKTATELNQPANIEAENVLRQTLSVCGGLGLSRHSGPIRGLAMTPDGRRLVTAGKDDSVWLWDLNAPDPNASPELLAKKLPSISGAAISADGHWLAVSTMTYVRLWDLRPREAAKPPLKVDHAEPDRKATLADEKERLAIESREPILLKGPVTSVEVMAFTPDYRLAVTPDNRPVVTPINRLAVASRFGMTCLWDLTTPETRKTPVILRGNTVGVRAFGNAFDSIDGVGFTALAVSSLGRWLIGTRRNGWVEFWDLAKAKDPATRHVLLSDHIGLTNAVAFSKDGHWFATAGSDQKVNLWDMTASDLKTARRSLKAFSGPVVAIAFSPDGSCLASAVEGALRFDPVGDPFGVPVSVRCEGTVRSLAFHPNGRTVAAGGSDRVVTVYDLKGLDFISGAGRVDKAFLLRGHEAEVTSVAYTPDGNRLVTASMDGMVRLWDLTTQPPAINEPVRWPLASTPVQDTAVSDDGRRLVALGDRDDLRLWDLTKPAIAPLTLASAHKRLASEPVLLLFSPDGRWFAAKRRCWTELFDLTNPAQVSNILESSDRHGTNAPTQQIAFSPDGHWAVTIEDARVRLINLRTNDLASASLSWTFPDYQSPEPGLLPESVPTYLLKDLQLDLRSKKNPGTDEGTPKKSGTEKKGAFRRGAPRILKTAYLDADAPALGNVNTRSGPPVFKAVPLAFSKDGQWLIIGSPSDNRLFRWDLRANNPFSSAPPSLDLKETVLALAFHPTLPRFAVLCQNKNKTQIRIWEITPDGQTVSPTPLSVPEPRGNGSASVSGSNGKSAYGSLTRMDFSPDGRWIFVTDDGTRQVILWDLNRGAIPLALSGQVGSGASKLFSDDGKWLATSGTDGAFHLWDLNEVARPRQPDDPEPASRIVPGVKLPVRSAAFLGNRRLVIADADNTVTLHVLRTEDLIDAARGTAGRNMTLTEWNQYFPAQEKSYKPTFRELPVPPGFPTLVYPEL